MEGIVVVICISPVAGEPMEVVAEAEAIAGAGLKGDRYATSEGSFSGRKGGNRQVTLINGKFFSRSGFSYTDSRRNIVTMGVELMGLIGKDFQIGEAVFRGIGYCDPCNRPSKLSGKERSFKEFFSDCGGLTAEIIESGIIKTGDQIIT